MSFTYPEDFLNLPLAARPYRAGLTRRALRNLRKLTGCKKPGKVRAQYDAGVKAKMMNPCAGVS